MPLSWCLTTIATPGSAAPWSSVTRPRSSDEPCWASALAAVRDRARAKSARRLAGSSSLDLPSIRPPLEGARDCSNEIAGGGSVAAARPARLGSICVLGCCVYNSLQYAYRDTLTQNPPFCARNPRPLHTRRIRRFGKVAYAGRVSRGPAEGALLVLLRSLELAFLGALDRLEERAEVAGSESLVALPLDDLEEEGARRLLFIEARRLLQEDLQQVLARDRRRPPGSRARAAPRGPRRSSRCRASRAAPAACRSRSPASA